MGCGASAHGQEKQASSADFDENGKNADSIKEIKERKETDSKLDPAVPSMFTCPLTKDLFRDPVTLVVTGRMFERGAILQWLRSHDTDPINDRSLAGKTDVKQNASIRYDVEQFIGQQCGLKAIDDNAPIEINGADKKALIPLPGLGGILQNQLKSSSETGEGALVDVALESAEYSKVRQVMTHFFGQERVICLKDVKRVENPVLAHRFKLSGTTMDASTTVSFKVHGTKASSAKSIVKEGFQLPTDKDEEGNFQAGEAARNAHDYPYLKMGGGLYFTSSGTKADAFGGTNRIMLICAVRLGRQWTRDRDEEDPKLTADDMREKEYDSIFIPEDEGKGLDEFVLFQPDQVFPMYVIEYRTVRVRTVEWFLAQEQSNNMMTYDTELDDSEQDEDGEESEEKDEKRKKGHPFRGKTREIVERAKKTRGAGNDWTNLIDEFVYIGDMCKTNPKNVTAKVGCSGFASLAIGIGTTKDEVAKWQALRIFANYAYGSEDQQKVLFNDQVVPQLLPCITQALRSPNEAVVQKAAFVACNMRSKYSGRTKWDGDMRAALKMVLSNAVEPMSSLYATAALSNFITDAATAADIVTCAGPMMKLAPTFYKHETWAKWFLGFLQNLFVVDEKSENKSRGHSHTIGAELARANMSHAIVTFFKGQDDNVALYDPDCQSLVYGILTFAGDYKELAMQMAQSGVLDCLMIFMKDDPDFQKAQAIRFCCQTHIRELNKLSEKFGDDIVKAWKSTEKAEIRTFLGLAILDIHSDLGGRVVRHGESHPTLRKNGVSAQHIEAKLVKDKPRFDKYQQGLTSFSTKKAELKD